MNKMKKSQYFLLVFLLLVLVNSLIAQEAYVQKMLDSLEKIAEPVQQAKLHNDLGFYFGRFDSLQGEYHARIALKIAEAHQLTKEKASAYKNFGLIQGYAQYQQAAINYYDTAYQIYAAIPDTSGMFAVLNNSGRRYCYVGDCETGIGKYQLAETWLKPGETYKLLAIRTNHAICLQECRAFEQCIKLSRQSMDAAIATNNLFVQLRFHILIANSLNALNRSEEALQEFEKAEVLAIQMDSPEAQSAILNDRGGTLVKMGLYEKAYTDFTKCLALNEKYQILLNDYRIYINLGEVTKELGQFDKSIQYYEIGLKGSEQTSDKVILADSYEMAAEAYNLAGKDKIAYEYMFKAKTLRDTVFTNEMRQNLQEINAKYETEKIKQALAASNLAIEKERNQNRLTLITSLSIFLLSGIGYFFYRGRQRRQKLEIEKRKIELEYGLLRAQMNPHFVFNSLNSIQGYFADNQFVQGNEFLGKFSRLIRRVLDQSVAPSILLSEELETLKLYLDVEKIRLKDKLSYEIKMDENVEVDLIKVPPLLLQPFAENAIWHGIAPKAGNGKVTIQLQMSVDDNFLEVQLEDDGVGLGSMDYKKEKHQSKGIQITKERIGHTGKITVIDKKTIGQTGVKVDLKIPIFDHD